ncbi:hypothetical protein Pcinc_022667 [Petrolisthes cinctipes]|uniref:Uncharacterized protein n=1 Tax=Petrolisthes cinctipes TaxID=88211 RepID=A0AAE1FF64_PETCI|nr:hypothetical protein Pcinc_022667 [Petrolisthes cinctipes]
MLRRQIVVSLRNWWWGCTSRAWTGRGVWCGAVCLWFLLTAHITILTPNRRPPHPTLTHQCYHNTSGLQLQNLCCRLHNYTNSDIINCVRTATNKDLYLKRYPTGERQGSSSKRQEGHFNSPNQYLLNFYPQTASRDNVFPPRPWVWVVVGDSRVRQVFSALITRINSPRLKYNKPSTGGKWRRVHELAENLRIGKLHEDIEVYHEDVPWNLTFIWDPRLTRLPKLLQRWTLNPQHRPTLLLIG